MVQSWEADGAAALVVGFEKFISVEEVGVMRVQDGEIGRKRGHWRLEWKDTGDVGR